VADGGQWFGARRSRGRQLVPITLLALLLVLGAYFRLAHLTDNPGWDSDEGYNLNIAINLAEGKAQMLAMRYTFVQHPPLFYLLGAVPIRLWTHDLVALRALSACCGVLTIIALYGLGSALGGRRLGWAAAGFYTIWPEAVLQVRWAYTYNLLALLVVLALWAAVSPYTVRAGNDILPGGRSPARPPPLLGAALAGGACASLALATDQEAAALVPALIYLWWGRDRRPVIAGLLVTALAPAFYLGYFLITRRADLLFDLQHTAARLQSGPVDLLGRLAHLFNFDPLLVIGLCALALTTNGKARTALIVVEVLFTVLILEVRDPAPFFRAAEPLLPLAALGVGGLILAGLRFIAAFTAGAKDSGARALLAALILLVPLGGFMVLDNTASVNGTFATPLKPVLPRSAADARRLAGWINGRVAPTDLVIAMPEIAWLFHCRTAELLQAVAVTGQGTVFYPAGLGPERFVYDPRLDAARYLVVDTFTRQLIAEQPSERVLVRAAQATWPVVYRQGEYVVYGHPR
jgi:4-amino-4-deoxy-L-arabinose transferase-like glycosyltransferase